MKKIKLLLLYLFKWTRIRNKNYPQDEVYHKTWGYRTINEAWGVQTKSGVMKKIIWFYSKWQNFGTFIFLTFVFGGILTQWRSLLEVPPLWSCLVLAIIAVVSYLLISSLIKDWRKWGRDV